MSRIRIFLSIIMSLTFTMQVNAQDLGAFLENMRAMQADFSQIIKDNHGKVVQKSFGNMALQRPGKFRWQVRKPVPQVIVANDRKIWIYDPDLEQVTIKSLQKNAGETPAILLSHHNAKLNQQFEIRHTLTNSKTDHFSLKPVNKDSAFALIEIEFNHQQLTMMSLKDHLGHTTEIVFKNIKVNPKLNASLFTFTPKRGLDVIDETKKT